MVAHQRAHGEKAKCADVLDNNQLTHAQDHELTTHHYDTCALEALRNALYKCSTYLLTYTSVNYNQYINQ